MTPYRTVTLETPILTYQQIVRYVNCLRALHDLSPITILREPTYALGPAHHVHCPVWLSVFDTPHITPLDVSAFVAYARIYGILEPPFVAAFRRRHTDLVHSTLRATDALQ